MVLWCAFVSCAEQIEYAVEPGVHRHAYIYLYMAIQRSIEHCYCTIHFLPILACSGKTSQPEPDDQLHEKCVRTFGMLGRHMCRH